MCGTLGHHVPMTTHDAFTLPAGSDDLSTSVLGTEYFPKGAPRVSRALFERAVEALDDDGEACRVARAEWAIVPVVSVPGYPRALAVVWPGEDGGVDLADQVGWVPERRVETLQPRIVSLARATGAPVRARGTATYWREGKGWARADGEFAVQIAPWDEVHAAAVEALRGLEGDVEQPWVEHYAPHTDLSKRLYAEGRGRSDEDMVPVRFEVMADRLVATIDGEVLTDCTKNGRDFFDLLRRRVETQGALRGWVRIHEGAVGVRHEDRP